MYKAPHTEEVKQKISETMKGRPSNNRSGKNGASTGKVGRGYKRKYKTFWITDGLNNTRISESTPIPIGWSKGRYVSL